jgi:hypothetical protein
LRFFTCAAATLICVVHELVPVISNAPLELDELLLDELLELAEAVGVEPEPLRELLDAEVPLLLPDEPDEPELLVPVTASPTATFTAVTRPATGALSVVPLSALCAEVTDACAAVTAAWSALICAVAELDPSLSASSEASFAWSLASVALASAKSAFACAVVMVPSTAPAFTVWPAFTFTAVTVPEAAKSTC